MSVDQSNDASAPVNDNPERSSVAVPNDQKPASPANPLHALKDPLPESGAGVFDGIADKLTFSHVAKCCTAYDYKFGKADGSDLFTGKTIKIAACSSLTPLECVGWCQPLTRLTEVYQGEAKAFSLEINSGILDSSVHKVVDASGADVGFIEQPTFVQRMSEMWRNRMNIVLRVRDTANYERWTLRRPGSCGDYKLEICKNYANFEFEISCDCSKYDCDYSKYNCGDCFGQCKLDGPCYRCTSCRQCCDDPRCLCLLNADVPCCDINCWNCDAMCKERCDPQFCAVPCQPGCGCCECQCKDCEICCKPVCSLCAICLKCECKPKCIRCENYKCCRCENCGANCKLLCGAQCDECKRCVSECPDCGAKCKVFYSKCKPQCQLEIEKCKRCIPDFIACCKKCPHRCWIYTCGGKPVHIELDVYGPDGDADVVQTKIMYDGYTGCSIPVQGKSGTYEFRATLRNGYTCTVHIPRSSPYYKHYHKKERQLDFHDLSLLTGLAMWYDFYCVAPLAVNNCSDVLWTAEDLEDHKPREASAAPNLLAMFGLA